MPFLLATLACTLAGMASPARANDAKPVPKPTATGKTLTDADLKDLLETMGYEVNVTESADKRTQWMGVKVTRAELGGTFEITVALSPNKKKLWAHVDLAELKPDHEANAPALLKLLERNAAIGPNHFRVDAKSKHLYMSRSTDNRGMTPGLVKEHLDLLLDTCVETKEFWNTTKWSTGTESAKK
jgi:hypothetical protein